MAVLSLSTSCTKRTNLNRIEGEWLVTDSDNFDDDYEYTFEFEEDGDFKFCYSYDNYSYCSEGEWSWDGDLEIEIDGEISDVEVVELTRDELVLEFGGYDIEFERVE